MTRQKKLQQSIAYLQKRGIEPVGIGIVLGTGLGDLVQEMDCEIEIDYTDIPHFPKATLKMHNARLLYGSLAGKKILVFDGRFHAYEGLEYFEITYPIRLMKAMGVDTLIISNAAGAINLTYKKGELMLIEDHINLQGGSPLAEKGIEVFGERFVDMSQPYDFGLISRATEISRNQSINLHRGVYASVLGPQLETKAEYRYLRLIGADAVGMSTVPEVIVANQLGIKCIAFSVLTDVCDPDNLEPIDIADILASAKKGEQFLISIVNKLLDTL